MKTLKAILFICFIMSTLATSAQSPDSIKVINLSEYLNQKRSKKIDYSGFITLGDSLQQIRMKRLISEEQFYAYMQDPNTVVLDARSKEAYQDIHIKGALHLNFSDFTAKKLKRKIPDKKTRILIYCNNNFESNRPSLLDKNAELALNIPTFINLLGYGYENVYELGEYLSEEETIIPLVGKGIENIRKKTKS